MAHPVANELREDIKGGIAHVAANSRIEHISAVTLSVRDMKRSVTFYEKMGFALFYGGRRSGFSSLRQGRAVVNLTLDQKYRGSRWGRMIIRVPDADAQHRAVIAQGFKVEAPRDAPWGERYFHVRDPDGHELSFAALLATGDRSRALANEQDHRHEEP